MCMLFHVNVCPDSLPTQESCEHGASSWTLETAEGEDTQWPAKKTFGGVHLAELLVVADINADVTPSRRKVPFDIKLSPHMLRI